MSRQDIESFESVGDVVADTPAEAVNLHLRSELMDQLAELAAESGRTQSEAAARRGVNEPGMNDLLRGRIFRRSLDALVNIVVALGLRVHLRLAAA